MTERKLPVVERANLVSAGGPDIGELRRHVQVLLSGEANFPGNGQIGCAGSTARIGRFCGDVEKELSPKMGDLGINSTQPFLNVLPVVLNI